MHSTNCFLLCGVKPIDITKLRTPSYCHMKIDEISTQLASKLFEIWVENERAVQEESSEQEIVNQLKAKFAETTEKEQKIKLLSVLPNSWSARKISKQFGSSFYLALLTKTLVKENGIMCGPRKRLGTNIIDHTTVNLVKEFYSNDNISRVCPGKRDYVTVDENNVKIAKQRIFFLMRGEGHNGSH